MIKKGEVELPVLFPKIPKVFFCKTKHKSIPTFGITIHVWFYSSRTQITLLLHKSTQHHICVTACLI